MAKISPTFRQAGTFTDAVFLEVVKRLLEDLGWIGYEEIRLHTTEWLAPAIYADSIPHGPEDSAPVALASAYGFIVGQMPNAIPTMLAFNSFRPRYGVIWYLIRLLHTTIDDVQLCRTDPDWKVTEVAKYKSWICKGEVSSVHRAGEVTPMHTPRHVSL